MNESPSSCFGAPANYAIAPDCNLITPVMLPLIKLDQQHINGIVMRVPGGTRNIQDIYPLTAAQEGMLFHYLLNKESSVHVLSTLLELQSYSHVQCLLGALQAVLDRHDILRTAILWEGVPRPLQVVYRHAQLPVVNLTLDPARNAVEQLKARIVSGDLCWDLKQAPLVRVQVAVDPTTNGWYLLLQLHHVVCDHESLKSLVSEALVHLAGRSHELPRPIPYRDHVVQVITRTDRQADGEFFRRKLGSAQECTAPFGLLDVQGDGSRIEEARRVLDPSLALRLRTKAREFGVTTARLFHAAWAIVVAQTSDRHDVVFGTVLLPGDQRMAQSRALLGMSMSTLPLRLDLQNITSTELIELVTGELAELLRYGHTSLVFAQSCSGMPSSAPLFTSVFAYRYSVARPEEEWSSAPGVRVLVSNQFRTNYPIGMTVDNLGVGFALAAQTDRRVDANGLTMYLETALRSLVDALELAPATPALSLSILPEEERLRVIHHFNATATAFPREKLVHELFEEQVQRTPQAMAVTYNGQSLSYRELNQTANQLARTLRQKGVRPDQLVGICVDRGFEMIVGLLAILKAGGAYLPLDPTYPLQRLAAALNDACPLVVMTEERLKSRLPSTTAHLVLLDREFKHMIGQPTHNLEKQEVLDSSHLAYVIYTSGSSGAPKGVMIQHASLVNFLVSMQQKVGVSGSDRMLAVTTISFDIAGLELFLPLLVGAHVTLSGQVLANDPELLTRLLESCGPTIMQATPSTWELLLSSGWKGRLDLKALCGGETLTTPLSDKLMTRVGGLWNLYGPTETTVWSACLPISETSHGRGSAESIGRPIANTQVYILNRQLQPVPIGVTGEIYIGGAGVARGYLHRPDLTAERFLPDPFSTDAARMYRTGDLGRWTGAGVVDCLGRNDLQVKIRGFRIELGEIETQLLAHPQVKDATVLMREDHPGDKRLVAYLILADHSEGSCTAEALRTHLQTTLPGYMIPSAFVALAAMPLTPNGKLDRRSLPSPDSHAYVSRQYEAPRGDAEQLLAALWAALLRVERVGRRDNFFELGGHSLLIVQMMDRLRQTGFSAELRQIFDSPTLADFATALKPARVNEPDVAPNLIPPDCSVLTPEMIPLAGLEQSHIERLARQVPGGIPNIQDVYPLAPLQEGILFHHLFDTHGGDTYVVPVLLEFSSRERLEEVVAALQAAIDRYDILRTAILWEDLPRPLQIVYREATLPVELVPFPLTDDATDQITDWLQPERQRLDLRHAPLVRLRIAIDTRGPRCYALLQLHHMTCDRITLDALVSEIVSRLAGDAIELPVSAPYRHHVARALGYARSNVAEAFFSEKLGDISEPTAPFGLIDIHDDGSRIEEAVEDFGLRLAERVRSLARRLGVTAATLFHSAWALVVARTTGRSCVVFGTVLLGRLHGAVTAAQAMGMFVNTLPLRISIQNSTVIQLVAGTQRELVELLAHEQASLAFAAHCSAIASSAPLFTTLLNYRHSAHNQLSNWGNVSGIRVLGTLERTNYPISLFVDDLGDRFRVTAQTRKLDPGRIVGYLRTAMQSLVSALELAPDTPALALQILPASERRQVLQLFNDTKAASNCDGRLIHELFQDQVSETPDRVAVVCNGRELTYSALNKRANQLAWHLRQIGIGPDQIVGIYVTRDLDMVVAMFGILKAGGAYLPLDPAYPIERVGYMLDDASPKVVLTDDSLKRALPQFVGKTVSLDSLWTDIAYCGDHNLPTPQCPSTSRQLAYVIYTSGSTGNPKGVMIEHSSVVNFISAMQTILTVSEEDRLLAITTISFDIAALEIYLPLVSGARVVLAHREVAADPRLLGTLLLESEITLLQATPTTWQLLMSSGWEGCPRLKALCGGEALTMELSRQLRVRTAELWNLYGPTETTIWSCARRIGNCTEACVGIESIGRPISNTQVYILDEHRQPVPIGIAGEIYIGGAGVGRGYSNRPALTSERFLADPFRGETGSRMYRTGDLGRWCTSGGIEYLGRNDAQVKIRGHRVEPGEIEAQLRMHRKVKEAAVIAREDVPGDRRLVAYVTAKESVELNASPEELRKHLKALLPDYMVPSAYVTLERMPRTQNEKLDRRAFPAPEQDAYVRRDYEPPAPGLEESLAEIWQPLLRVARVSRHENFFGLGGDSILAMQATVRMRSLLGIDIPVSAVFRAPTLEQLAKYLRSNRQLLQAGSTASANEDRPEDLLGRIASMPDQEVLDLLQRFSMRGTS